MPVSETHDDDIHAPRRRFGPRGTLGLAAAGLLLLGGAAGAVAITETRPSVTMAPVTPVAIRSLSSSGIVTIRGQVAEIYGNKAIVADGSGRALVDLGREGEGGRLVTTGEPVTVQGRFEEGFVHAAFLVGPDNKVVALGPLAGPPHGPHDRHGPDGGPGGGPDGPPPPPPPPGADRGPGAPPPPPPPAPTGVAPAAK